MSVSTPNSVRTRRWMDWQPKGQIIANSPASEATKPPKLSSVGFEGAISKESAIIRGQSSEPITEPFAEQENPTFTGTFPSLPSGVRLLNWNLKQPPVAIDTCSVVTDPALFARSTLEQLKVALENPKRWVGWTVAQLMDRLAQVGVVVALKEKGGAK